MFVGCTGVVSAGCIGIIVGTETGVIVTMCVLLKRFLSVKK